MRGYFELTLQNGEAKVYRNYASALTAFEKEYGWFSSYEEMMKKKINEKIRSYSVQQFIAKYGF